MSEKHEEYTDPSTGVRLTVEYDVPDHPRITAYWSEDGTSTLEELHEAIRRLMTSVGVYQETKHE